jgi:hypothetical protein
MSREDVTANRRTHAARRFGRFEAPQFGSLPAGGTLQRIALVFVHP